MELTRSCQQKAHDRTTELLQTYNKCIVKMFCGTGKSRVIRKILLTQKKMLSIVVFPSLALIRQFTEDYLTDKEVSKICTILNVSSEQLTNLSNEQLKNFQSTTEPAEIQKFTVAKKGAAKSAKKDKQMKIVCVTYQSLQVLLDNLCGAKIGLALFDEAHRTVSPEYSKLVYGADYCDKYEKQVFFTATPVNANGITMFDRERDEMGTYGDCGPLASEYTYLQGLRDGHLSLFELRVDLYTQDTVANMYECIARAILTTGNTRVLTFHADSAEDSKSETSVLRFVDKAKFVEAFRSVCAKEFPDKVGMFPDARITFTAITADTKNKDEILNGKKNQDGVVTVKGFEQCTDDEIYIVSSCRTIGEGVDTKNANMCVFVDPKSSPKDIIQNIGRICRKIPGVERQPATVLIPVCIGWEKYVAAGDDAEIQDKLIREQLNDQENGDYNAIMNVCAALKQEDPELYELCLKYPSNFTESERKHALESQKKRNNPDDYVYREEIDELVENGERVEIHTSNIEQPIIYRGFDEDDEEDERPIQRFYEVEEENEDGEMETRYHRIVPLNDEEEDEDESRKRLNPPKTTNRPRMNIHTNDEIKLLWKMGDVMLGEQFGSGVLECEVERMDKDELWKDKHQQMCEFMDENGRAPSAAAKDPQEQRVGAWINTQKNNYDSRGPELSNDRMKTPERWKIWNETLADPKYKKYLVIDYIQDWKDSHEEMCKFIDKNGKAPSSHSKYPEEKTQGSWKANQKINYDVRGPEFSKQRMKNPEIWKIWNETLSDPRYKKHLVIDRLQDFMDYIAKLCKFIEKTGRAPSPVSKDLEEKTLGHFVSRQKSQYDSRGPEFSKLIMKDEQVWTKWTEILADPRYNKYLVLGVQGYMNKIANVRAFIDKNGKAPSQVAKDPEEKTLGNIVSRQKSQYDSRGPEFSKHGMKNPEMWKIWNETLADPRYKKYLVIDRLQDFMDDIAKVRGFIDKTGRAPSTIAKDPEEKTLGNIVSRQKSQYDSRGPEFSKHGMKNPEMWKIWTEIIQKYPCLKKQGKEQESPSPSPSPPPTKPKTKVVSKKSHLIPKSTQESLECASTTSSTNRVITDSPYKLTGRAWATQKSCTTHEKLQSNPDEWHAYHAARDISFQGYTDQSQIPRNRIIAHLATKRKYRLRILDLGCGRNNIAHHFTHIDKDHKFTIQGYDHVAEEGSGARVGNIADLAAQEEDQSAKICIYSQSLMGSDWRDYLTEGYRILEYGGEFIISEHIKMLDDVRAELGRLGCKVESENADTSATEAVASDDLQDMVPKWFVLVARKA